MDGHQFPVDIGLNPIETEEGVMVLSSIIDLTEKEALKHKLEERNRQVVEAHALATVGRMAAMVAHDLRNPLSSVKMGLQILSRSRGKRPIVRIRSCTTSHWSRSTTWKTS